MQKPQHKSAGTSVSVKSQQEKFNPELGISTMQVPIHPEEVTRPVMFCLLTSPFHLTPGKVLINSPHSAGFKSTSSKSVR